MLDALGIGGMKKTQYGALSTGQKRRLHLALALTGRPDVVFLDEPTAGLDVEGRVALHAQIRACLLYTSRGLMILLGVRDTDTLDVCEKLAQKCAGLRIFEDAGGKLNVSAEELGLSLIHI